MATKNDKTINVKWSHNGAYRRFQISGADDVDIYEALLQKVRSIIPDFNDCFAWNDEDGDEIVFSSYAEMKEALALPLNQNLFRIYTVAKPSTQPREAEDNKDQTKEEKRAKVVHNGVVCDECDKEVVGIRYKCAVCDDYDLCEECERKGKHSQHSMIRYATPNMPFYGGCGRGRCRRGCHHPRFHHAAGFRSPFATGLVTSYPAMATQIATAANEAARTAAQYAASTLAENMARASAAATGTAPPPPPPPPPPQQQQNANSQHVPPQPPPPPNPFGNIVNGMDFLREIGTQVQQALSNFGIEVDMDVEHGGQTERVPRPSQTSSNNNNNNNNNDNNNTNNDNNNNNNTDKGNGNDKQTDETPNGPTDAKEVNADSGDVVMTPAHTDDVVTEPMSEMHISNDKEPEQQADKTVGDKENGAKEPEGSEKEKGNVMLVDIDDEGNDTEMWTMMDKNDVETTAKTNDAGSVEKVYPNLSDIGIKCMAGTPFITPLPGPHNPHCPLIAPDRQVATCVEQLEAMGFDNCNGWLTKLAMVHQGDTTRVIENLGSDPVYSQRLQAAL